MGRQLRRWHTTEVERLHREGRISTQVRNDLCNFRRHSTKTAQRYYEYVSQPDRDAMAASVLSGILNAD